MTDEPIGQQPAELIEEIDVKRPRVDEKATLEAGDLKNRRDLELEHEKFKQALRTQVLNFRRILFYGACLLILGFFALGICVARQKFDDIGINHNYLILAGLPTFIGTLIALALIRNVFGSQEQKEEKTGPSVLLEVLKEFNKSLKS